MFEGDDVTYAEVGRRIEKVQEILTGAGLRAGDKVALLSSNMPNWSVCYFAIVYLRHGRRSDIARFPPAASWT